MDGLWKDSRSIDVLDHDAKKDASLRTKKKYTVTRYKLSNE